MKVYIAGTHGTIEHEININKLIKTRLLSYYSIKADEFGVPKVFNLIKNEHILCRDSRNHK